jgi:hypothetical protein
MKFHWIAVPKTNSEPDKQTEDSSPKEVDQVIREDSQMKFHWIAVGKRT